MLGAAMIPLPYTPAFGLLVAVVAMSGCHRGPAGTSNAVGSSAPSPLPTPSDAGRALPPLGGEWLVRLPLQGFGDAVVSVPLGATSPRSVVVGVHGRNDRPEWACGEWRGVTDAHPFILCPHGVPIDAPAGQGLALADAEQTGREIDAGLAALEARFGAYVQGEPLIYAGFSLGAIRGVPIAAGNPGRFPVLILGEGGQEQWTSERVAAFAKGGGRRVLFVCSTGSCETAAASPLGALARAGVQVKLLSAGHIGHLVDDRVVAKVHGAWPWVTGEGAWQP
jgi:hypothetical protein